MKRNLQAIENRVEEKFLNETGDQWEKTIGDNAYADESAKKYQLSSLPIVITITNSYTSAATNVPLFFSNYYFRNVAKHPAGITYAVANYPGSGTSATYDNFLGQLFSQPMIIGKTYWEANSQEAAQVTFTLTYYQGYGTSNVIPLTPYTDLYANQTKVNQSLTKYSVTSSALMYVSSVAASTSLRIHFYPMILIRPDRELFGEQTSQSFSNSAPMGVPSR